MKKRNIKNKMEGISMQNPVAKFAHRFNKTQTFCDKSKYSRKFKHGKQEAFPIFLSGIIGKASCFFNIENGVQQKSGLSRIF